MVFNGDLLGMIVGLSLSKRLEFVSWDDEIPNLNGKISQSCSRKTTNQQESEAVEFR